MQRFVKDLNALYKGEPALYEQAFKSEGFQWIELGDHERSVFAYLRKGFELAESILIVLNLTPVTRENYRVGVPYAGEWEVLLNSDDTVYHGSGVYQHAAKTEAIEWMGCEQSIAVTLPPLGGLVLKRI